MSSGVYSQNGLKTQTVQNGMSNMGYFGVEQIQNQLPIHSQVNESVPIQHQSYSMNTTVPQNRQDFNTGYGTLYIHDTESQQSYLPAYQNYQYPQQSYITPPPTHTPPLAYIGYNNPQTQYYQYGYRYYQYGYRLVQ